MKNALCVVLEFVLALIVYLTTRAMLKLWKRFRNRNIQNLDLEKALVKESP